LLTQEHIRHSRAKQKFHQNHQERKGLRQQKRFARFEGVRGTLPFADVHRRNDRGGQKTRGKMQLLRSRNYQNTADSSDLQRSNRDSIFLSRAIVVQV